MPLMHHTKHLLQLTCLLRVFQCHAKSTRLKKLICNTLVTLGIENMFKYLNMKLLR